MKKYLEIIALTLVFTVFFAACQKADEKSSLPSSAMVSEAAEEEETESGAPALPKTDKKIYDVDKFTDEQKEGFSAKKHGAAGDGKTDDTNAINTTIQKIRGPLYLPEGRYLVSAPIVLKSNYGIFGEGTIVIEEDYTEGKNGSFGAISASNALNVIVKGIKIEKKPLANSILIGVLFIDTKNLVIDGVEVSGLGARAGIEVRGTSDFEIKNCYVHDFLSDKVGKLSDNDIVDAYGIHLRVGSKNGYVHHNKIKDIIIAEPLYTENYYQSDGIYCQGVSDIRVEENEVEGVGEGIDVGGCFNMIIKNNKLKNIHMLGFKVINGTKDSVWEGNEVDGAAVSGVWICVGNTGLGAKNITFKNNKIYDIGKPNDYAGKLLPRAGIKIACGGDDLVSNIVIENNHIEDRQGYPTTEYGIIETGSATGNIFRNNTVVGCANEIEVNSPQ